MKKVLLAILIMAFAVSCLGNETSDTDVKIVTAEEVQEITKMEDVQLIDVRTPEEYEEGHLANSQNIDYYSDTFEEEIMKLDKSKPVLVYCKSGNRSGKCTKKMEEAGFVKIYDMEGGIVEWKYKGYDIQMIP